MKKETSSAKRMHDALRNIANMAAAAQHPDEGTAQDGPGTNPDLDPDHGAETAEVGCYVKSLPQRLWQDAADRAAEVNPVNAPVAWALAELSVVVGDPLSLTVLTSKYWGPIARRLLVSFVGPQPAVLRTRILSHMNAWARTSCVSFAETTGVGHVRIATGPGGYWSYLGTDILLIPHNRPTMNLQGFSMNTSEGEFRRVVRHETGHTLGFPHEHMRQELVNRIDPQKAYAYFLRTQGWDRRTVDQQVLTPLNNATIMGTAADQTSIMCYQLPGSITRDGRPITGGVDINATDFAFAGRIYPRRWQALAAPAHTDDWGANEDVPAGQIEEAMRETVYADSAELAQEFESNGSSN